jgi:hypothetical protein
MFRFSLLLFLALAGPLQAQVRSLPIKAQRPATTGPAISHYVANPLTLTLTLDATRPTLTGAEALAVEIRTSVTDTTPALALTEITSPTGPGPFTLALSGPQLNQPLGGQNQKAFWLVVYTMDDAGETLDVLYTAPLTLKAHGASLSAASPPNVVGNLNRPQADALYAPLTTIADLQILISGLEAQLAGLGPTTITADNSTNTITLTADNSTITSDQSDLTADQSPL